MNPNVRRIAIGVAAMLVTLGLLYCGQLGLKKVVVDDPIANLYRTSPDVVKYQMERTSAGITFRVKLREVKDLMVAYRTLEEQTANLMKGRPFRIVLEDERDEELSRAYYRIHFSIQEALATGEFTKMAETVERLTGEMGIRYHRVYVDDRNVYVQIHANGRYLYEVVPRQPVGRASG